MSENPNDPGNTHVSERGSVRLPLHDIVRPLQLDPELIGIGRLRRPVDHPRLSAMAKTTINEPPQQDLQTVVTRFPPCRHRLVRRILPHMQLLSRATIIPFLPRQLVLEAVDVAGSHMMHHLVVARHIGEDEVVVISPVDLHPAPVAPAVVTHPLPPLFGGLAIAPLPRTLAPSVSAIT